MIFFTAVYILSMPYLCVFYFKFPVIKQKRAFKINISYYILQQVKILKAALDDI